MTARPAYLRDALFPRAVADGAFGPDAAYETFAADDDDDGAAADQHFASDIVFGTVTVRRNGAAERHRVVVKFKNADARMSAAMNMHAKFHNESVFYARLLPALVRRAPDPDAAAALFPRFVYSNATADGRDDGGGGEQVVVVANVKPDGYREPDGPQPFLDADHVLLAARKLGALHGLSYAAKARAADGGAEFMRALTADLSETQWFGGHWFKAPRFLSGIGRRGVNALQLADPVRGGGGRLDRLLSLLDGESATIADALRPVEPLAVLCHGDYCRNNLLFRYDAATGRPADVVMVDPAQARYASPAVDLSFFLYMNTTAADRAAHWDDFVAAYVAGAAESAGAAAAVPDAAAVHGEMRGRCVYGLAHCSFFLPAMVDPRPPDVERLNTCSDDEFVEAAIAAGGPRADGLLASVVGHMVDRDYV